MKILRLTILLFFFSTRIKAQNNIQSLCGYPFAQDPCFEVSPTNFNSETDKCFDWTVGTYRVAILKTDQTSCLTKEVGFELINSPFYPRICGDYSDRPIVSQPNNYPLWIIPATQLTGHSEIPYADKDMHPSQGWTLVTESLGRQKLVVDQNGNPSKDENGDFIRSKKDAVTYPSFILYNKYTGLLRIFVYDECSPSEFNGVEINLYFKHRGDNYGTRLFDDINTFSSALNKDEKILTKSLNVTNVTNSRGIWYIADYMTSFDPCAIGKTSGLELIVDFNRMTTFNVDLKVNGTIVSNQSSTIKESSSASLLSNFDYKGIGKATISAYKEFDGYRKTITEYSNKLSQKNKAELSASQDKIIKNQLKLDPSTMTDGQKTQIVAQSPSGDPATVSPLQTALLGVANVLPYVGTIYGLYKHFSSGSKSIKSSPTISTVNLTVTGTIELKKNSETTILRLPGTSLVTGGGTANYNRTLGLFKVLKTPKLSYFNYRLNNIDGTFKSFIEGNWSVSDIYRIDIENGNEIFSRYTPLYAIPGTSPYSPTHHYNGYTLRQYYLNEPMKVLVNNTFTDVENANLDVLSAEAAFVLEYDKSHIADLDKMGYLLPRGYFPILPNYTKRVKKFTDACNDFGWFVESATENIEERNDKVDFELLRIRSKYLPLNIFDKQSFFLSWPTNIDNEFFLGSIPKAEVKLVITYRPKDPNYVGPNLLFIRSFEVDLNDSEENINYVGNFGLKLTNSTITDLPEYKLDPQTGMPTSFVYPRECLFANTEIEKITYNKFFPNRLGTYQKEPNANLELLNSNPYQVYTDERTLDIFDPDLSFNENTPYNNLSSRLLFFNGSSTVISPFWKNWSNVIVASTGEFLAIRHPRISIPDGDFNIPSNFSQCSFSNSKIIIIDNAFNQTPINFSKCEFVASEKVLLSGKIKLEAGSVIGNSKNPIFRSTPQYYLNGNIATQSEINYVCESQEYKDAVSVLSVKPTDPFFDNDSSNFKNRIQPIAYNVFPNPANNTVTVQAPKSETVISEIVLKNLLGMEVQRFIIKNPSSDVTIDVSTIPVGLYILNVNNFSTRLGIQR